MNTLGGGGNAFEVSSNWTAKSTKKGGGIIFQDPKNPHNSIRQMLGNPNSPNPAQRNPYIIFKKNGAVYDLNGNSLPSANHPDAHIPVDKYVPSKMPKFE